MRAVNASNSCERHRQLRDRPVLQTILVLNLNVVVDGRSGPEATRRYFVIAGLLVARFQILRGVRRYLTVALIVDVRKS